MNKKNELLLENFKVNNKSNNENQKVLEVCSENQIRAPGFQWTQDGRGRMTWIQMALK